MKTMKSVLIKYALLVGILLVILASSGCKSTPEYIYVQPECYQIQRKKLPKVDAGVLYDVLNLPHNLHPLDVNKLLPDLPTNYDGYDMYWQLVQREKLITDMLIDNETIVRSLCK